MGILKLATVITTRDIITNLSNSKKKDMKQLILTLAILSLLAGGLPAQKKVRVHYFLSENLVNINSNISSNSNSFFTVRIGLNKKEFLPKKIKKYTAAIKYSTTLMEREYGLPKRKRQNPSNTYYKNLAKLKRYNIKYCGLSQANCAHKKYSASN